MLHDWQKIETAPQDMRSVLVFVPGTWELPCEYHVAFLKRGAYYIQADDHSIIVPTHWAPLDPPEAA